MSFYLSSLIPILQERIAYFNSAGLGKEAELLQERLKSIESKTEETQAEAASQSNFQNSAVERARSNLKAKLGAAGAAAQGCYSILELEKQFILENIEKAETLKQLEPLRRAYIDRLLKISRAARSKNIELGSMDETLGPYNDEKTFCEALQLIYSQDPLWIEDFKELYLTNTFFTLFPFFSK